MIVPSDTLLKIKLKGSTGSTSFVFSVKLFLFTKRLPDLSPRSRALLMLNVPCLSVTTDTYLLTYALLGWGLKNPLYNGLSFGLVVFLFGWGFFA